MFMVFTFPPVNLLFDKIIYAPSKRFFFFSANFPYENFLRNGGSIISATFNLHKFSNEKVLRLDYPYLLLGWFNVHLIS